MKDLDSIFRTILQNNVKIMHANKVLRSGKLLLYYIEDYYIVLVLMVNNRKRQYELPIPFDITLDKNLLIFNYNNDILNSKSLLSFQGTKDYKRQKKSKFYNDVVSIEIS